MSRPVRKPPQKRRQGQKLTPAASQADIRALLAAVRSLDADTVRELVKGRRVPVNVVDEEDRLKPTPLLLACERRAVDIVRTLLTVAKPKADVNKGNTKGRLPVWWAAKHGDAELTELLLYDGKDDCDVKTIDEESGCTPLYRAILSDAPDVCRLLIHAGGDVNLRRLWKVTGESEVAESPLVKSVQMGSFGVCQVLVNSLCHINAKTEDGFTALHYAVGYRRYAITEFLLENGCHVNVQSRKGITAMTVAIREYLGAMCRILIEWGYDVDRRFRWDESPLEMAIRLHSETCAMTLVAWGCRIVPDRRLRSSRRSRPPSVFARAAAEGLVRLLRLMIDMYPYFLDEPWVLSRDIPLALYRHTEFCDWLTDESSRPRPLASLCKSAILLYMGKYGCRRIHKLPLPPRLAEFLSLDHHFTEKEYRQEPLEAQNCPYYCPVMCPRLPQCPDLDFSDSASD